MGLAVPLLMGRQVMMVVAVVLLVAAARARLLVRITVVARATGLVVVMVLNVPGLVLLKRRAGKWCFSDP